MKTFTIIAVAFALSGCQYLGGEQAGAAILKDLQSCRREYTVAIGAGVTGSGHIVCEPVPAHPPDPG